MAGKSSSRWVALAAIGTLLGGVAALVVAIRPYFASTQPDTPNAYYVSSCEKRMEAINLRASLRSQSGQYAVGVGENSEWCSCTAAALDRNFDDATIRAVADWFQAVALGAAERSAEETYFASLGLAQRRKVEGAYDFASGECNGRKQ